MSNAPAERLSRIGCLDGIRGWAAILVLQDHIFYQVVFPNFYPDFLAADSTLRRLSCLSTDDSSVASSSLLSVICSQSAILFLDGRFAVLIFFVLSGFALSAKQLNPDRRNLALAAAARYFRLMIPILVTSLIAFVFLRYGLFFNLRLRGLGEFYDFQPSSMSALKFSIFDVFFAYDNKHTYDSVLWTMPTEFFGSLLIFGFLGIFKQGHQIQWKIVLLLTACLLNYDPYISCFMFGYILSELNDTKAIYTGMTSWHSEVITVACFVIAAIAESFVTGNDKWSSVIAVIIVFSIMRSGVLRGFFSNSTSAFLGRISFPMYLIQMVVICSWSSYFVLKISEMKLSNTTGAIATVVTTEVMCLVSSLFLLPIERLSVTASKFVAHRLVSSSRMRN